MLLESHFFVIEEGKLLGYPCHWRINCFEELTVGECLLDEEGNLFGMRALGHGWEDAAVLRMELDLRGESVAEDFDRTSLEREDRNARLIATCFDTEDFHPATIPEYCKF
jgi:hypothetical protein